MTCLPSRSVTVSTASGSPIGDTGGSGHRKINRRVAPNGLDYSCAGSSVESVRRLWPAEHLEEALHREEGDQHIQEKAP